MVVRFEGLKKHPLRSQFFGVVPCWYGSQHLDAMSPSQEAFPLTLSQECVYLSLGESYCRPLEPIPAPEMALRVASARFPAPSTLAFNSRLTFFWRYVSQLPVLNCLENCPTDLLLNHGKMTIVLFVGVSSFKCLIKILSRTISPQLSVR